LQDQPFNGTIGGGRPHHPVSPGPLYRKGDLHPAGDSAIDIGGAGRLLKRRPGLEGAVSENPGDGGIGREVSRGLGEDGRDGVLLGSEFVGESRNGPGEEGSGDAAHEAGEGGGGGGAAEHPVDATLDLFGGFLAGELGAFFVFCLEAEDASCFFGERTEEAFFVVLLCSSVETCLMMGSDCVHYWLILLLIQKGITGGV